MINIFNFSADSENVLEYNFEIIHIKQQTSNRFSVAKTSINLSANYIYRSILLTFRNCKL